MPEIRDALVTPLLLRTPAGRQACLGGALTLKGGGSLYTPPASDTFPGIAFTEDRFMRRSARASNRKVNTERPTTIWGRKTSITTSSSRGGPVRPPSRSFPQTGRAEYCLVREHPAHWAPITECKQREEDEELGRLPGLTKHGRSRSGTLGGNRLNWAHRGDSPPCCGGTQDMERGERCRVLTSTR